MRVVAKRVYIFHANLLDRTSPSHRTNLVKDGDAVRVVNLPGCPRANTMNHCHIQTMSGEFAGLVHCNSLHTKEDYIDYLKRQIAVL